MKCLLPIVLLCFSCKYSEDTHSAGISVAATSETVVTVQQGPQSASFLNPEGTTIATRFNPNPGYTRAAEGESSFGAFLQSFPLKPDGAKVYLHNGEEKYTQSVHAAVLDISTGKADLQQCADAVMRLRAEYLWEQERFDDIHFNFVNGFNADYVRWRTGDRIWVKGNKTGWRAGSGGTPGRAAFDQYLKKVFMFANTASLEKELQPVRLSSVDIGDVLIRGGFPGHAVLVVDKAVNASNGTVQVLLAQSYMPAQDIHVLRNPDRPDGNPWYEVPADGEGFLTMEYIFSEGALRRFVE